MPQPFNPEVARTECAVCSSSVSVKVNKGGMAYYRCDVCSVHQVFYDKARSDAWLSRLAGGVTKNESPKKPVEAPAKPPEAAPPPPPAKRAAFSLWGGA
jgi:hypothetical protein